MGEDGRVVYRLVIDDSGAVAQAEAGGKKAGGAFEQIMVGAARRIGEAFVNMAAQAVKGVEQIARAGIEFNAKIEQYETAFKTLLGTEEEAARVMAQIREDAARTPFDVDSLTSANQMLISAGISADTARKDILNLANAIAATGGGSAELSRMAANLQQIQNTGKATAMDIRQFANAGINIYGLLADAMGVTTEQAAEMDVTYEQLTAALEKASGAGGKYAGALEAQSQTFTGRISTLKDNATQLAGALTKDLFSTLSNNALPMVMDWVATLLEAAETGGIRGAIEAARGILSSLIDQFIASVPDLLDTGLTMVEGVLTGVGGALPQVVETATSLILTISQAIIEHLPELIEAGISIITGLIDGLLGAIPLIIEALPEIIEALFSGFLEAMPRMQESGFQLLGGLIDGLLAAIPALLQALPQVINNLLTFFVKNIPHFIQTGMQLLFGLINGIIDAIPDLVRMLPGIIRAITTTIAAHLPDIIRAGFEILGGVITGLLSALPSLLAALPEIVAAIFEVFATTPWLDIGVNIVTGIWDGIKSLWGSVVDAVTQMAQELWSSVKSFFGIASPSKKFRWIGEMNMEGMIAGFEDEEASLIRTVTDVYSAVPDAAQSALALPMPAPVLDTAALEQSVSVNMTATGSMADMMIVIPLTLDGREIARATAWSMGEQLAWEEI